MASSSLTNMSVSDPGNMVLIQPKYQFRWRVTFTQFGQGANDSIELTRQVIDLTRPNVTFAQIKVEAYNSTVKLAGKHTWAPMTMNIRDDALGLTTSAIGSQLQKQLDFQNQASAASGTGYKFVTIIDMLDGGNGATGPNILEQWELYGCYLTGVNYNTANYGTSDSMTIGLNIEFDNAAQTLHGTVGDGGLNRGMGDTVHST